MGRRGPVVFRFLTFMHSSVDKDAVVENKCTKQEGMESGFWIIGHPTGGLGRMESGRVSPVSTGSYGCACKAPHFLVGQIPSSLTPILGETTMFFQSKRDVTFCKTAAESYHRGAQLTEFRGQVGTITEGRNVSLERTYSEFPVPSSSEGHPVRRRNLLWPSQGRKW